MQFKFSKAAIIHTKAVTRKYLRNDLRDKLSQAKISVQLCALALLFALITSGVIILFRLTLNWAQVYTLAEATHFTDTVSDWRTYLPILGALLIWLVAGIGSKRYRRMGIAYVLHRFKLHYGKVPLPSAAGQFFQALIALVANFSVGKEGPAIHLGAVSASFLAEKFKLPDNSVRIMCASGIAAGIAAIFNAPLAAVLFVFEVIVREYKIHYFFPIMLSAICGALSSQLVFGNIHEYDLINVTRIPLDQYPILAIGGIVLGCTAALFNHSLLKMTAIGQHWPLIYRLMIAAVITTLIGLILPQALGSGDLAIEAAISEHPSLWFLGALLVAKIIATIAAISFGIPGGLIGPLYGIGALIGAMLALVSAIFFPSIAPYVGLYTVIGMTAMMGVCLSAPLAALVALLELTNDAAIILPAMFVTIPAFLIAYQGFNTNSVFLKQLDIMGLGYKVPPVNLGLQKKGVRALMDKRFVIVNDDNDLLLEVMKRAQGRPVMVRNADNQIEMLSLEMQSFEDKTTLSRHLMHGVADTATLNEVYELLSLKRSGEVYIYQNNTNNVVGVISWANLWQEIRSGQV
ncbi:MULTISPECIES: chloride channel protein [unclassified Shewanella]|uniref:chloride channel protein n=1 Tax=unclassified Shewanella TaxID=196818 RepID=UPI000C81BDA6|nr:MULTISPECIES: chloride channel protein [unclassified Shewanella]MDO6617461.1 chloride channel protein [Shewanella sp. 6_MG-2023]MDO6638808.1 chloride channel protein [Shewanella sp. 5_MG-2023]MDO6677163.1 chloride channel protein [Shewanella sp. 4_MG-2023]MDO6773826.1 chloride channel protein [Shewanella sp. 3_MG-2023]PMG31379.1 chloride channel protein [Shewanella sp. 10N.286.52.C2]